MAVAIIFWAFLLSGCLLVLWYGRMPERSFIAFLVFCTALTFGLNAKLGIFEAQNALFALDVVIFVAVLAITRTSQAYWPVWFAGFQAIIVCTGLARLILPSAIPSDYINAAGFWALPALLALVVGTLRDQRARTARLQSS